MKLGLAPVTLVLAFAFASVAAPACAVENEEPAETASSSITNNAAPPAAPQIVDGTTLATYKAAVPKVAWPELQAILESPSTLWFDKATMIPSYQDSVGDNAQTPIGARANSQGRAVIVQQGKRLFSDDGKTWALPFAHTAGTDKSTNVFIVNFLERAREPRVVSGSKAIGEPPLMLALSVREAIREAIGAFGDGDAKDSLTFASPATPERIFFAVQRVRSANAALL